MRQRHRTLVEDHPLRVVIAGAGWMGVQWIEACQRSTEVELVGIADLRVETADAAVASYGLTGRPTGTDAVELAERVKAEAIIDVTVPAAHYDVTNRALRAGFPVLGEKPLAANLTEAIALAGVAEVTGELFMVSQSRRYYRSLYAFRDLVPSLGTVGIATVSYFEAPHFGGFREEMASPMVVDMSIHALDSMRFILNSEPEEVTCVEFNPKWSWYQGAAVAQIGVTMESGARISFLGSWCSPGLTTSSNSEWRLSGSEGTAIWDGTNAPWYEIQKKGRQTAEIDNSLPESIDGALAQFVSALRTGETPHGEVHENAMSFAMVETALRSSAEARPIRIREVVTDAYRAVLKSEAADVQAALRSWADPVAAIGATR
jgi:predicted dehydrogenase